MDEDFDYPVDDLITDHGWVPFSGIGINPIHVVYPGLEYPCYACVLGNAVRLHATGEDVYKFLHHEINSGSVYVSFMVNVDTARTGDFFLHLGDSVVNNSNKIARVYVKKISGDSIAFGLAKDNETPDYSEVIYKTGETYLLVLKYTFVSGGSSNDLVSLFIFDDECLPTLEPTPTIGPLGGGQDDLPNIGKIVLNQGAGSKGATLIVDGICVFPSWDNGALPVELSAFSSTVSDNKVTLNWITTTERNNSGFNIERSISEGVWSTIGSISGNGTSTTPQQYTYTDRALSPGIYYYRLKQIDYNGNFEYFNLSNEVTIGTSTKYSLSQNYPNPFNPTTQVTFSIPKDGDINIKVFDLSGKEVLTEINEFKTAGQYTVTINGSNLSSGIYYYKITAGNFTATKKMTLIK